MSEQPNPPIPSYFQLNTDGHFKIRPDLLAELCFEEAMTLTLPKTEKAHTRWLSLCGFTAKDYPFVTILEETDLRYQPTHRVLLHTCVLPGNSLRTCLITDARGWSAPCEPGGLFDFVLLRAVEFAAWRGFQKKHAWDYLHAATGMNATPMRRLASWSVGYDRATGSCTILSSEPKDAEAAYLKSK